MTRIQPLRWLGVVIMICAALLSGSFLLPRDEASQGGNVVVAAPDPVPVAAPGEVPIRADPVLISVLLHGRGSSARLRLASGTSRSVALDQQLMPGWTLVAVESGSVTFATPDGRKQLSFVGVAAEERQASVSDAKSSTVLIPEASARSADGQTVERCLDPEC
jgi:hypothetical protein